MKRPGYGGTKSVLFILSLVAVLGMLIGGGVVVYGLGLMLEGGGLFAMPLLASGVSTVIGSLLLLAVMLVFRVVVDHAQTSGEMLCLMRRRWGSAVEPGSSLKPAVGGESGIGVGPARHDLAEVRPQLPGMGIRPGKPRPDR
jgi:hypothetical protein